ncbi:WecB/TagA/CpsF family glycosyltransferase [Euzebya sp.]|uniref:WecB/TagA/CpsF family glycosyltransferase n=1 Tax=Euzebya sp. TaxID=1971409 RepID=UPI0035183A42
MAARRGGVDVLGVHLDTTSYADLLVWLDEPVDGPRARTVAFCNVHSVMTARRDPVVARALAAMDVATTDGMPLVWAARRLGHPAQGRVYGPDLMEMAVRRSPDRPWRHYLYGASPDVLARLVANLRAMAPDIDIAGWHSPPYRPLTPAEEAADVAAIARSGATHVWVGLGMPKQELFVQRVADRLGGTTLLAVGAAFDMHAGVVSQAPDWIQDRGLEWAYRWAQEPTRLASRYLVNNPLFLLLLARQLAAARLRTVSRQAGVGR